MDLRGVDLTDARLIGVDLSDARMSEANLSGASLSGSVLYEIDFSGANLSKTNLSGTDLWGADLSSANLAHSDLSASNLSFAILSLANLGNASLGRADLSSAQLSEADLTGTDLIKANLNRANLKRAKLTGAMLYGTARDDWAIEGVKCRYVFWDWKGEERSPKDRDLEPGEFERLYAQLPTIEYIFEQGMTPLDPLVMDRVVQAINEGTPEFDLQIDSISARGLQPTIKFTVQHEEHTAAALEAVVQQYAITNAQLQGANEALSGVIDRMIRQGLGGPVTIGSHAMVALGGSSFIINTEEYIVHLEEIERAIKEAPPETLSDAAKREALEIVSGTFKDVAMGKAKEVAEAIVQLGIKLGPSVVNTQAHEFFKNLFQ